MAGTKYLTDAELLVPACDKWGTLRGIVNANGGLTVLSSNNNLADINDLPTARRNLGVAIGLNVQAYSQALDALSAANPSTFALSLLSKQSPDSFRNSIQAGTVQSVSMDGGNTGLTFAGGTVVTNGTFTLGGKLAVANGGTGATSLPELKTNLNLNNVNNTADKDKPISNAAQAVIDAMQATINSLEDRIVALETSGGSNPNVLRSAIDGSILNSAIDGAPLTSALS